MAELLPAAEVAGGNATGDRAAIESGAWLATSSSTPRGFEERVENSSISDNFFNDILGVFSKNF